MSKQSVNQVIQRAIGDAAFRRQLQRDASSALAGLDLSADERAAITSGDPTRLTALGVDQRMSKAFGLGGLSDVSKVVVGDTSSAGSAAFIDEGGAAGTGALVSPNTAEGGDAALIAPDGSGLSAGFVGGDSASSSAIAGDPGSAASAAFATPDGNSFDAGVIGTADGTTPQPNLGENMEGPTLDAGIVGGSDTHGVAAFDTEASASFGTQVITGDQQDTLSAFETGPGATPTDASIAGPDDASSTLAHTDTDWMPTFDGHVDDVNQQQ